MSPTSGHLPSTNVRVGTKLTPESSYLVTPYHSLNRILMLNPAPGPDPSSAMLFVRDFSKTAALHVASYNSCH